MSKVKHLICSTADFLSTGMAPDLGDSLLRVQAFKGYQTFIQEGYSFFLPEGYKDMSTNLHSSCTGTYYNSATEVSFAVQIQQPQALDGLFVTDSQHIRWVAVRQRQVAVKELTGVLIVRNAF